MDNFFELLPVRVRLLERIRRVLVFHFTEKIANMTSALRGTSFIAVPADTTTPFLFVYGSHMSPQVLSKLLGRVPMMISDATLDDYGRFAVFRKTIPAIIPRVGSHVKGVLLPDLTAEELVTLDLFQGDGFERQCVTIRTVKAIKPKRPTHTYVWTNPTTELDLIREDWDFDFYCHHHLQAFLEQTVEPYRQQLDDSSNNIVTDGE
jgi:gamma-glutamylcyclotransferase (GGCT)/AIG2-like uncharacterized protein YtfP